MIPPTVKPVRRANPNKTSLVRLQFSSFVSISPLAPPPRRIRFCAQPPPLLLPLLKRDSKTSCSRCAWHWDCRLAFVGRHQCMATRPTVSKSCSLAECSFLGLDQSRYGEQLRLSFALLGQSVALIGYVVLLRFFKHGFARI